RPRDRGPARDPALRRAGHRPRSDQHRRDLAPDPRDPRAHARHVDRGDARHRAGPGDLRPGGPADPRQAALRRHTGRVPREQRPRGARLRRPPGGGTGRHPARRARRSGRGERGGDVSTDKPLPPPPPPRGRHREVWVGLFVVFGVLATIVVLAVMTDAALFRGRYIINTKVPNASGIRKGDPVLMRGVNIGRILSFTIQQQEVQMRLEIEGEYPVPRDSRIELKASGLLGGMVADIVPGSSPQSATWGDTLPGGTGVGLFDKMDALAGEADKVAKRVQGLLSDDMVKDMQGSAAGARQSLDSLQAILKEQRSELRALSASLKRSSEGLEKVTTGPELERTTKRIDEL